MSTIFRSILLLMLGGAIVSGCASTGDEGYEQEPTTVEVRNQNFLDMNIYVITESSHRQRLGTVSGLTTRTLTIPRNLVFGHARLRFEMHPIGSRARPVSQDITVATGDRIVLTIPNF